MTYSISIRNKIPSTKRRVNQSNVQWILRNILNLTSLERKELLHLSEALKKKAALQG